MFASSQRCGVVQIEAEFKRFSKYCEPEVRVANYVGGIARKLNVDELKDKTKCPHIVIGTPGRLKDLVESGTMPTADLRFFIVDECDKIFEQLGTHRCCARDVPMLACGQCCACSLRRAACCSCSVFCLVQAVLDMLYR